MLQELVPNGGKVDTVTMLDKAITYVKFMQLQLKVRYHVDTKIKLINGSVIRNGTVIVPSIRLPV